MPSEAMQLKDLHTEMNTTFESVKEYADKVADETRKAGEAINTELRAQLDKANQALTQLRKDYEELCKRTKRPKGAGEAANDDPETELRKSAFIKYMRYGVGETGRTMMSTDEIRALSSASDADGGFLVPVQFEPEIIMNAYNMAALRPLCQVGTTSRDVVQLGKLSKPVVAWGTTNLPVSAQDLNAGTERLTVYPLRALMLIANDTLEDAAADVWGELSSAISDAIAEAEDDAFVIGTGAGQPAGIMTDSRILANVTNTGVADALSDATHNGIDRLIDCMQKLKSTYRRNATWVFNSLTEGKIRQLTNDNGDYLWQPPVQPGMPANLLGRPIAIPEAMPDIAANSYPIAIGDFRRGFKIRDRSGVTVQRLVERYSEYDQTGFQVKRRTGGQPVKPEAFQVVKVAA